MEMAIGTLAFSFASNAAAYEGRLVNGVTGKPAADVWVIGHWTAGGGFGPHGGSGCLLAITKTNHKGEFTLVNREGLIGWLFPERSRPNIDFYQQGFRARKPEPTKEDEPFYFDPDASGNVDRIQLLRKIVAGMNCGEQYSEKHKLRLIPVYRDIANEEYAIATAEPDKRLSSSATFAIDAIEWGHHEAVRRARDERERRYPTKIEGRLIPNPNNPRNAVAPGGDLK